MGGGLEQPEGGRWPCRVLMGEAVLLFKGEPGGSGSGFACCLVLFVHAPAGFHGS